MYKFRLFSEYVLDFSDVINYLKSTNYPFESLFRDGVYSTGLHLDCKVRNLDKLINIFDSLIKSFKYQFIFGYVGSKLIKFNYNDLLSSIKPNDHIELFFQPTIRVKIDKLTQYHPKSTLFHATSSNNLSSIMKYGLLPKGRNQCDKGYNYYPAVHLLTDLNGMVRLENGELIGAKSWKSDLVLFEINPGKNKYVLDPAADIGVITYDMIPVENIRLVDKSEYEDLFKSRSLSNYQMFNKNKFRRIN